MTGISLFGVPLEYLVFGFLGVVFALTILANVASWANNRRIRRKVHEKYRNLDQLGEHLVEYVAKKTHNKFDQVPLTKFWVEHKVRPSVRYVVIDDLVEEGYLRLPERKAQPAPVAKSAGSTSQKPNESSESGKFGSDIAFVLTHWIKNGLCIPPNEVVLTEKQWERARDKERSPGISMGPHGQLIWQQGDGAMGNIAGRDIEGTRQKYADKSKNKNRDSSQHVQMLRKLHIALLDDATRMPDDGAAKVREMAKELDDALDSNDETRDGRLNGVLKRIQDATAFAGGMMTSTAQILTSIKDMGASPTG